MRRFLIFLLLLLTVPLHAATTPAEKLANDAAQHELDTSPKEGNIPSYALKPTDLAKAQHLDHIGTVLHFGDPIWSLIYLVALLATGVIGWMQRFAVEKFRNRLLQGATFLLLFIVINGLLDAPLNIYGQHLTRSYGLSVQS